MPTLTYAYTQLRPRSTVPTLSPGLRSITPTLTYAYAQLRPRSTVPTLNLAYAQLRPRSTVPTLNLAYAQLRPRSTVHTLNHAYAQLAMYCTLNMRQYYEGHTLTLTYGTQFSFILLVLVKFKVLTSATGITRMVFESFLLTSAKHVLGTKLLCSCTAQIETFPEGIYQHYSLPTPDGSDGPTCRTSDTPHSSRADVLNSMRILGGGDVLSASET